MLSQRQLEALGELGGKSYDYPWMLSGALGAHAPAWVFRDRTAVNKRYNMGLQTKLSYLLDVFRVPDQHRV